MTCGGHRCGVSMIEKLISGGQNGADISIVRVGEQLNIPTGWVRRTG